MKIFMNEKKDKRYKFITILFIQILWGMEMDLFIPSFPELQHVFNLTPVMVQLTISVNFLAVCICSLYAGALGDRYDRRHVILSGLLLFVLGSTLCVMAPNFLFLIMGRILQGIGISAPAILSFPVILEDYPTSQQPNVMGFINGIKTFSMAIAPLIGSFVNLYFGWRANFSILLGFGILCLLTSYFFIPSREGHPSVSLSLKTYLPLLQSKKYLALNLSITFLTAALWMFMAMAPIFYMQGMGVSLKYFGLYQGIISLTFAFVCIISPVIYLWIGQKRAFHLGIVICLMSGILMLVLSLLHVKNPMLITVVLAIFSAGIVFPINIVYPLILDVLPNNRGRAAGLGQAMLLLFTGILLEIVAYFYNGQFMAIGFTMSILITLSLFLIQPIYAKKWL